MHIRILAFGMWALSIAMITPGSAYADGDPEKGARVFRPCMACHSLKPGLHLTGPSLADIWDRKAGTAHGFFRYSKALKNANVTWNDDTLDAWLKNPRAFIPDNYMGFAGIESGQARQDLIAYLKTATSSEHVEKDGEGQGKGMMGRMMHRSKLNLKDTVPKQQVEAIRYCADAYFVTLATGDTFTFWEFNLRFKTDSSKDGPPKGKPAIVRAGKTGERAFVAFADPEEISTFVTRQC